MYKRQVLVPALRDALRDSGVSDPDPLLSRLIGTDPVEVQESVLRQQLALQIMYPAGLSVLKEYEGYDPTSGAAVRSCSLGALLQGADPPTEKVLRHFADGVRAYSEASLEEFALLEVPVVLDLDRLHRRFMTDRLEICRSIRSLCEIVHLYNCDVLLLTGRPSRLPGVQSLFRALLPLSPDRILTLHEFRAGPWYPFNRQGRVDDPKTTAAVGAMLCVLGQGRLPNFFFRANALRSYSTVRYVGLLDQNMIIKAENVYFGDVDLDNPDYELPDLPLEMRGVMHLGYRQLAVDRWGASPLYVLDFADEEARERLYREDGGVFLVYLEQVRGADAERFKVKRIETSSGRAVRKTAVTLKLNTLTDIGLGDDSHWLDSGSVFRI